MFATTEPGTSGDSELSGGATTISINTWHRAKPFVLALLPIFGMTVLMLPFQGRLDTLNVTLLYLIVITALSLRFGTWPSILSSVAAFLAFDFFFIPPFFTLTVARADHVLALFVFLGIAILTTQLTIRVRTRTMEALRRGRQTETLNELSSALISEIGLADMLMAIVERVRQVFGVDTCAILLEEDGEIRLRATSGDPLDYSDQNLIDLARWVMDQRQPAGLRSGRSRIRPPGPPRSAPQWNFASGKTDRPLLLFPIATTRRPLGVLVVARHRAYARFETEEERLLETFANQAAIAIERSLSAREQTRAEILARSDELKSALLSAVSHDLRTPLASIKASVTSLLQPDITWPEEERRDLLSAINEEADRLNQLVANLLDLSRIEAGALRPDLDWYDLSEAVYEAVDRAELLLHDHRLTVTIPEELPALRFDLIEIIQVLVNLLDNAAKYSPPDTAITLSVRRIPGAVEVMVRDEGPGIPPGEEERIFDKFYRVEATNRKIGSGVGLAICRGIIEAHGGRIWAERNRDRGSTIRFTLPVAEDKRAVISERQEGIVQG